MKVNIIEVKGKFKTVETSFMMSKEVEKLSMDK